MTINEIILTVNEITKLGDPEGNYARNIELCIWLETHQGEN